MSAVEDSRAAPLWDPAPYGLISLLELMQKLAPILSAGLFSTLARAEHQASICVSFLKASDTYKNNISLSVFYPAELLCHEAGLQETLGMLTRIKSQFARGISYGEAKTSLENFRLLMLSELGKCPLFISPKEKIAYFDQDKLFGESVYNAFPSARMDIKEAGNCWALGRNNAVVYHLMLAAEFGLRALAKDRRVEIKNRNGNLMLLEFAQWGEILGELRKKVDTIKDWPATPARSDAQQFYNDAIANARGFNDGWRTHFFHARSKEFQDDETLALIGHVKRFMVKLSERRISETEFTDEIWS